MVFILFYLHFFQVKGTDFILALVLPIDGEKSRDFTQLTNNMNETYHRIDLTKNSTFCLINEQIATKGNIASIFVYEDL